MTGFDSLVVGVDGSDASLVALAWAVDRLSADGTIHAVHGFEVRKARALAVVGSSLEDRRAEVAEHLDGGWTADARRGRGRLVSHVVDDDPADALRHVAEAHDADAIVVGPHNKRGNPFVLGSVTRKLLRSSDRPLVVATTRSATPPTAPDGSTPDGSTPDAIEAAGRVVACVGYGEATREAARWAADHATATGAGLTLLHAIGPRPIVPFDSPSDTLASYLGSDVSQEWAQADLDDLEGELRERHPDLDIVTVVARGLATRIIAAAGTTAELIVVGRRDHPGPTRMFVSPRIQQAVARSAAPVAVIPTCTADR